MWCVWEVADRAPTAIFAAYIPAALWRLDAFARWDNARGTGVERQGERRARVRRGTLLMRFAVCHRVGAPWCDQSCCSRRSASREGLGLAGGASQEVRRLILVISYMMNVPSGCYTLYCTRCSSGCTSVWSCVSSIYLIVVVPFPWDRGRYYSEATRLFHGYLPLSTAWLR